MNRSLFPTSVVTKAFTWAYQELGLNVKQASEILGISPSSLAQTTLLGFESGTVEYRKQLAFIRMYHLLIAVSEGDSEQMKVWFSRYSVEFDGTPFAMCKELDGIEMVSDYLRALKQNVDPKYTLTPFHHTHEMAKSTRAQTALH